MGGAQGGAPRRRQRHILRLIGDDEEGEDADVGAGAGGLGGRDGAGGADDAEDADDAGDADDAFDADDLDASDSGDEGLLARGAPAETALQPMAGAPLQADDPGGRVGLRVDLLERFREASGGKDGGGAAIYEDEKGTKVSLLTAHHYAFRDKRLARVSLNEFSRFFTVRKMSATDRVWHEAYVRGDDELGCCSESVGVGSIGSISFLID
jgi:hypothetical protein